MLDAFQSLDGVLDLFQMSSTNGNIVNLIATDDCAYQLAFESATVKRQPAVVAIGAPTLVGLSAAFGDPHFRGPNGLMFDVSGVANASYRLFEVPNQFAVAIRMAVNGPTKRFIAAVDMKLLRERDGRNETVFLYFDSRVRSGAWLLSPFLRTSHC